MALKGFRAFSDVEARLIKENLLRGVTVSAIARHFGVSTETISKIKRGLSYAWVMVEGEKGLRPEGWGEGVVKPAGPQQLVVRQKTEEEILREAEESEAEIRKKLAAGELAPVAKPARKVDDDTAEMMRRLGVDV